MTNDKEYSQAKRIRTLFTKQKKLMGSYYKAVDFEEPFAELIRNNGETELYEKATKGVFKFTHSSGEEREIFLTPSKQIRRTFLDRSSKGYILHEDNPLPLPENPILTVETMNLAIEKTLNDIRKWKAEEYEAKSDFVKSFAWILGIAIAGWILYKLLVPSPDVIIQQAPPIATAVKNTTVQIINATRLP
jgi:hypothetical protein